MATGNDMPLEAAGNAAAAGARELIDAVPSLVVALLILVAGWLLARVARRVARRIANSINALLDRVLRRGEASATRLSAGAVTLAGEFAFWTVLLLAAAVAASAAGLGSFAPWLSQAASLVPNLILGVAIIGIGFFLGVYLRELASATLQDAGVEAHAALGRVTQSLIFALALIIGLDQVGIDVIVLVVAFAIFAGGLVIGLFFAFGQGARDHVRNLIGARNARHWLTPGIRLRIGQAEGVVLDVSATHVALDTAEGRRLVPAGTLDRRSVVLLAGRTAEPTGDG
jgi:flagellar biogenesis protein FliO